MAHIVPTMIKMYSESKIPIRGGVYIDVYNQIINEEISGAIHTRISQGNYWYVTELFEDTSSDKQGLD